MEGSVRGTVSAMSRCVRRAALTNAVLDLRSLFKVERNLEALLVDDTGDQTLVETARDTEETDREGRRPQVEPRARARVNFAKMAEEHFVLIVVMREGKEEEKGNGEDLRGVRHGDCRGCDPIYRRRRSGAIARDGS